MIIIILIIILIIFFLIGNKKKKEQQLKEKLTEVSRTAFAPVIEPKPTVIANLEPPASPCTPEIIKQVFETYYTSYDGQFSHPVRCKIKYKDQEGNISERWIDVCGSEGDGDTLLHCYCWKHKEPRQFRTSRILECVTDEGTFIDKPGIYFKTLFKDSPFNHLERLLKERKELFTILVFLARMDGAFRKAEKDFISNYLLQIDGAMKVEHIIWRLEQLKPSEKDFEEALKTVKSTWKEEECMNFEKVVSRLYGIDKQTSEKDAVFNKIVNSLKN